MTWAVFHRAMERLAVLALVMAVLVTNGAVAYRQRQSAKKERQALLAMLEDAGVNVTWILDGPPMPAIDARVAAVKNDVNPNLVLLSVGSDEKVEKGFHFSIYRGTEFVGKVVVEKVLAASSGCRVLFTRDGQTIRQGDSAATRLR